MNKLMRIFALSLLMLILLNSACAVNAADEDKAQTDILSRLSNGTLAAEDVVILRDYGVYNGYNCKLLGIKGEVVTTDIGELSLGNIKLIFSSGVYEKRLVAEKEGEMLYVKDAFEKGLLGRMDIYNIAKASGSYEWEAPYSDTAKNAWYYDALGYVTEAGMMKGTGNGKFSPNTVLTRAQVVQILFNLSGEDEGNYRDDSVFTDVAPDAWYAPAVNWAKKNGITLGIGNGRFGANAPATREQIITLLYKYFAESAPEQDISKYTDANKVSEWAVKPFKWAVSKGVVTSTDKNALTLSPKKNALRSEIAQMLYNCFD